MIGYKSRVGRRVKSKFNRNLETLYREGKCRECSVVVTRMDFAKILGKFTKVKIQYESSTPKASKPSKLNSNVKLKNNENGLISLNKQSQNSSAKDTKFNSIKNMTNEVKKQTSTHKSLNILKENNICKSTALKNSNVEPMHSEQKQYGIIFVNPTVNSSNDTKCKVNLADLIPNINKNLLPNDDWCIEFFPKNLEPKDDKMYNRIAAELEDLMNNKINATDNKMDDFPSIMDILNDNSTVTNQAKDQNTETKPTIETHDVEAMLLGNSETKKILKEEKDANDITDVPMTSSEIEENILKNNINPHSPSILDEALKEGSEQHIPSQSNYTKNAEDIVTKPFESDVKQENCEESIRSELEPLTVKCKEEDIVTKPFESDVKQENCEESIKSELEPLTVKCEEITEVIFKKILDGKCDKTVTCLKNLKYKIQLQGKSVEFIGAPNFITSIEDIQVLLQIVNDTTFNSLYVLH